MPESLNLLKTLTLLGAAQGVLLTFALLRTKNSDNQAHRILAMLILVFSINLGEEYLYQSGFFASRPNLLHVLAPVDLLFGPLIYLYVNQLTRPLPDKQNKRFFLHLFAVPIGIVLLTPFYLMNGEEKLAFTELLRKGDGFNGAAQNATLIETGFRLFMLGLAAQLGAYLFLTIRRLKKHTKDIKETFSDIDKISLAWLRNLIIGLAAIFLIYLGDQIFPDLLGINALGDSITFLTVLMIYAIGYLGLRQPAIFTRRLALEPPVTGTPNEPAGDNKYLRSGLDKAASAAFLKELTNHMASAKPYLDGNLLLPQLAQQLGISANYLSQIINEQLNINFYDFINGYRVEEAKRRIENAGEATPNILAIALDAGFNSKSAFYAGFKKATAMTPTQYRKSLDRPVL